MELRQYGAVLSKWLRLIVLGALLAAVIAFLVSRTMTPIYQTSTTLMVSQALNPTIADYTAVITGQQLAKTYGELLKKRPVLDAVITKLNLPITAEQLGSRINVQLVRDTQLITLQVEHEDPTLAAGIANTMAREFIDQNLASQLSRFANFKDNLLKERKQIEAEIAVTQDALDQTRTNSPLNKAEAARLETTLAQSWSSYSNLLKSYEDIRVAEAKATDTVMIVEPAMIPLRPVRPNVLLNTLLAAIVGATFAAGIGLLAESLDDRIHSSDQVDAVLHLPTLGVISRMQAASQEDCLAIQKEPRSSASEAYRVLRANIQYSNVDKPPRTILVTSASPLEGKSTTAANLAAAIAQGGLAVALVDSDLRRPVLHRIFETANDYGLTNTLLHSADGLNGSMRQTQVERLGLLPSGPIPPNPSELLGSERMHGLISDLRRKYDVVIFDSPPVLAASDAAVLAPQVDAILLVVDAGQTRRGIAQRALASLMQVGGHVSGVVLNKLSSKHGSNGYYYYYSSDGIIGQHRHTKKLDSCTKT